jgi:branched-chain amino acid transport system substrate-binding protein
MKQKIGIVLLAAMGVAASAHAQETLKIGALVTLSGAGAAWGQALLHGAELAADEVNAKGGLDVGGKKYKVQVIPYDDKYQANEGVTVANRLVFEDKVKYMIGPVGSAVHLAIQPITEKNKVIVMTLSFSSKALRADTPFTFRPNVTTGEISQPQIDWVVKARNIKRLGALFPNDETGQSMSMDIATAYQKAGATLTAKEFFERDRVDFVPLLTRILATKVDAIELDGNSPTTAGLIVKQARELGFTGAIIRTGGPATQEIINVAGKQAAEGLLVHTPIDPAKPSVKAYSDLYAAKYKHPMNGFSPAFYDGTRMMFQAMRKAGSVTDSDKVRLELEKIKTFSGALGELSWTGKTMYGIDHQLSAPFYVAEVKDGQEVMRAQCTVAGCK